MNHPLSKFLGAWVGDDIEKLEKEAEMSVDQILESENKMSIWTKDLNGIAENHWVDFILNVNDSGEHWEHAAVKFDGCIHWRSAGNVPFSKDYGLSTEKRHQDACDGYFHICDIDEYINNLISLRDAAKKHFGKDWNK